jgi:hypothetical protein
VNGTDLHVCVHALHALAYDFSDENLFGLAKRAAEDASKITQSSFPNDYSSLKNFGDR